MLTLASTAAAPVLAAWAEPTAPPVARLGDARSAVEWMTLLYERVRTERLSPPAASRVYAYAGVTLYEAVVGGMPDHVSLAGQLNGMPRMPPAAKRPYDWPAAAASALATVAPLIAPWRFGDTALAFGQLLGGHRAKAAQQGVPTDTLEASIAHGATVGQHILAWAAQDGFEATRSLPYETAVGASMWLPTVPGFARALEPHWGRLRPFCLAAPETCMLATPVPYSGEAGSEFYCQALHTYEAVTNLNAEQLEIAQFWADNPGETGTPSGHWVAMENQLVTNLGLRLDQAAEMYARVGVALADAFIACWHAKYRINLLRPVTYVERHIDPRWRPLLPTPPFPEYPSGHSVASAAAAEILTDLFGERPFTDRTHAPRGFRPRLFSSFRAAAAEAAISRLYGGIHYPMGIEAGFDQGRCIGRQINTRLQLRRYPPIQPPVKP